MRLVSSLPPVTSGQPQFPPAGRPVAVQMRAPGAPGSTPGAAAPWLRAAAELQGAKVYTDWTAAQRVAEQAPEAERENARRRADGLLRQLRADPLYQRFEKLYNAEHGHTAPPGGTPEPAAGAPTPSGYTGAQADHDAKALELASQGGLAGWGTDEDAIWDVFKHLTRDDVRQQLDQSFDALPTDLTMREMLVAEFEEPGSELDKKRLEAYLEGGRAYSDNVVRNARAEAIWLRQQLLDNPDRQDVINFFGDAPADFRAEVLSHYVRDFGHESARPDAGGKPRADGQAEHAYLLQELETLDFSGDELARVEALLQPAGASAEQIAQGQARADAMRLRVARGGLFGLGLANADMATIRDVLAQRPGENDVAYRQRIRDIQRFYEDKYDKRFDQQIAHLSDAEQKEVRHVLALADAQDDASLAQWRLQRDAWRLHSRIEHDDLDGLQKTLLDPASTPQRIQALRQAYQDVTGGSLEADIEGLDDGAHKQLLLQALKVDDQLALIEEIERHKPQVDAVQAQPQLSPAERLLRLIDVKHQFDADRQQRGLPPSSLEQLSAQLLQLQQAHRDRLDARRLRLAVDGAGTEEADIFAVIGHLDRAALDRISARYAEFNEGEDLKTRLMDELRDFKSSSSESERVRLLFEQRRVAGDDRQQQLLVLAERLQAQQDYENRGVGIDGMQQALHWVNQDEGYHTDNEQIDINLKAALELLQGGTLDEQGIARVEQLLRFAQADLQHLTAAQSALGDYAAMAAVMAVATVATVATGGGFTPVQLALLAAMSGGAAAGAAYTVNPGQSGAELANQAWLGAVGGASVGLFPGMLRVGAPMLGDDAARAMAASAGVQRLTLPQSVKLNAQIGAGMSTVDYRSWEHGVRVGVQQVAIGAVFGGVMGGAFDAAALGAAKLIGSRRGGGPSVPPPPDEAALLQAQRDEMVRLLALDEGASDDDIKRAYRRAARRLHPDVNPDPQAAEQFKALAEAYGLWDSGAKQARLRAEAAAAAAAADPAPEAAATAEGERSDGGEQGSDGDRGQGGDAQGADSLPALRAPASGTLVPASAASTVLPMALPAGGVMLTSAATTTTSAAASGSQASASGSAAAAESERREAPPRRRRRRQPALPPGETRLALPAGTGRAAPVARRGDGLVQISPDGLPEHVALPDNAVPAQVVPLAPREPSPELPPAQPAAAAVAANSLFSVSTLRSSSVVQPAIAVGQTRFAPITAGHPRHLNAVNSHGDDPPAGSSGHEQDADRTPPAAHEERSAGTSARHPVPPVGNGPAAGVTPSALDLAINEASSLLQQLQTLRSVFRASDDEFDDAQRAHLRLLRHRLDHSVEAFQRQMAGWRRLDPQHLRPSDFDRLARELDQEYRSLLGQWRAVREADAALPAPRQAVLQGTYLHPGSQATDVLAAAGPAMPVRASLLPARPANPNPWREYRPFRWDGGAGAHYGLPIADVRMNAAQYADANYPNDPDEVWSIDRQYFPWIIDATDRSLRARGLLDERGELPPDFIAVEVGGGPVPIGAARFTRYGIPPERMWLLEPGADNRAYLQRVFEEDTPEGRALRERWHLYTDMAGGDLPQRPPARIEPVNLYERAPAHLAGRANLLRSDANICSFPPDAPGFCFVFLNLLDYAAPGCEVELRIMAGSEMWRDHAEPPNYFSAAGMRDHPFRHLVRAVDEDAEFFHVPRDPDDGHTPWQGVTAARFTVPGNYDRAKLEAFVQQLLQMPASVELYGMPLPHVPAGAREALKGRRIPHLLSTVDHEGERVALVIADDERGSYQLQIQRVPKTPREAVPPLEPLTRLDADVVNAVADPTGDGRFVVQDHTGALWRIGADGLPTALLPTLDPNTQLIPAAVDRGLGPWSRANDEVLFTERFYDGDRLYTDIRAVHVGNGTVRLVHRGRGDWMQRHDITTPRYRYGTGRQTLAWSDDGRTVYAIERRNASRQPDRIWKIDEQGRSEVVVGRLQGTRRNLRYDNLSEVDGTLRFTTNAGLPDDGGSTGRMRLAAMDGSERSEVRIGADPRSVETVTFGPDGRPNLVLEPSGLAHLTDDTTQAAVNGFYFAWQRSGRRTSVQSSTVSVHPLDGQRWIVEDADPLDGSRIAVVHLRSNMEFDSTSVAPDSMRILAGPRLDEVLVARGVTNQWTSDGAPRRGQLYMPFDMKGREPRSVPVFVAYDPMQVALGRLPDELEYLPGRLGVAVLVPDLRLPDALPGNTVDAKARRREVDALHAWRVWFKRYQAALEQWVLAGRPTGGFELTMAHGSTRHYLSPDEGLLALNPDAIINGAGPLAMAWHQAHGDEIALVHRVDGRASAAWTSDRPVVNAHPRLRGALFYSGQMDDALVSQWSLGLEDAGVPVARLVARHEPNGAFAARRAEQYGHVVQADFVGRVVQDLTRPAAAGARSDWLRTYFTRSINPSPWRLIEPDDRRWFDHRVPPKPDGTRAPLSRPFKGPDANRYQFVQVPDNTRTYPTVVLEGVEGTDARVWIEVDHASGIASIVSFHQGQTPREHWPWLIAKALEHHPGVHTLVLDAGGSLPFMVMAPHDAESLLAFALHARRGDNERPRIHARQDEPDQVMATVLEPAPQAQEHSSPASGNAGNDAIPRLRVPGYVPSQGQLPTLPDVRGGAPGPSQALAPTLPPIPQPRRAPIAPDSPLADPQVQQFIAASPTLSRDWAALQAAGWEVVYSDRGTFIPRNRYPRRVHIGSDYRGHPHAVVSALAHEVSHLVQDLRVPPATERHVAVAAHLDDEGRSVFYELKVRDEVLRSTGLPAETWDTLGSLPPAWIRVYNAYRQLGDEAGAVRALTALVAAAEVDLRNADGTPTRVHYAAHLGQDYPSIPGSTPGALEPPDPHRGVAFRDAFVRPAQRRPASLADLPSMHGSAGLPVQPRPHIPEEPGDVPSPRSGGDPGAAAELPGLRMERQGNRLIATYEGDEYAEVIVDLPEGTRPGAAVPVDVQSIARGSLPPRSQDEMLKRVLERYDVRPSQLRFRNVLDEDTQMSYYTNFGEPEHVSEDAAAGSTLGRSGSRVVRSMGQQVGRYEWELNEGQLDLTVHVVPPDAATTYATRHAERRRTRLNDIDDRVRGLAGPHLPPQRPRASDRVDLVEDDTPADTPRSSTSQPRAPQDSPAVVTRTPDGTPDRITARADYRPNDMERRLQIDEVREATAVVEYYTDPAFAQRMQRIEVRPGQPGGDMATGFAAYLAWRSTRPHVEAQQGGPSPFLAYLAQARQMLGTAEAGQHYLPNASEALVAEAVVRTVGEDLLRRALFGGDAQAMNAVAAVATGIAQKFRQQAGGSATGPAPSAQASDHTRGGTRGDDSPPDDGESGGPARRRPPPPTGPDSGSGAHAVPPEPDRPRARPTPPSDIPVAKGNQGNGGGQRPATPTSVLGTITAGDTPSYGVVPVPDRDGLYIVTNDRVDIEKFLDPRTRDQSSLRLTTIPASEVLDSILGRIDRELPEAYANRLRAQSPTLPDAQLAKPRTPAKPHQERTMLLVFRGDGTPSSPFVYVPNTLQTGVDDSPARAMLAFAREAAASGRTIEAELNQARLRFEPIGDSGSVRITVSYPSAIPRTFAEIDAALERNEPISRLDLRYYDDCLEHPDAVPTPHEWSEMRRDNIAASWFEKAKAIGQRQQPARDTAGDTGTPPPRTQDVSNSRGPESDVPPQSSSSPDGEYARPAREPRAANGDSAGQADQEGSRQRTDPPPADTDGTTSTSRSTPPDQAVGRTSPLPAGSGGGASVAEVAGRIQFIIEQLGYIRPALRSAGMQDLRAGTGETLAGTSSAVVEGVDGVYETLVTDIEAIERAVAHAQDELFAYHKLLDDIADSVPRDREHPQLGALLLRFTAQQRETLGAREPLGGTANGLSDHHAGVDVERLKEQQGVVQSVLADTAPHTSLHANAKNFLTQVQAQVQNDTRLHEDALDRQRELEALRDTLQEHIGRSEQEQIRARELLKEITELATRWRRDADTARQARIDAERKWDAAVEAANSAIAEAARLKGQISASITPGMYYEALDTAQKLRQAALRAQAAGEAAQRADRAASQRAKEAEARRQEVVEIEAAIRNRLAEQRAEMSELDAEVDAAKQATTEARERRDAARDIQAAVQTHLDVIEGRVAPDGTAPQPVAPPRTDESGASLLPGDNTTSEILGALAVGTQLGEDALTGLGRVLEVLETYVAHITGGGPPSTYVPPRDSLPGDGSGPPSGDAPTKGSDEGATPPPRDAASADGTALGDQIHRLFERFLSRDDLAFDFPDNGCTARAELMMRELLKLGFDVEKIWVFPSKGKTFKLRSPLNWMTRHEWRIHVAVTIPVRGPDGRVERWVIDPSLHRGAIRERDWAPGRIRGVNIVTTRPGEAPLAGGDNGLNPFIALKGRDPEDYAREVLAEVREGFMTPRRVPRRGYGPGSGDAQPSQLHRNEGDAGLGPRRGLAPAGNPVEVIGAESVSEAVRQVIAVIARDASPRRVVLHDAHFTAADARQVADRTGMPVQLAGHDVTYEARHVLSNRNAEYPASGKAAAFEQALAMVRSHVTPAGVAVPHTLLPRWPRRRAEWLQRAANELGVRVTELRRDGTDGRVFLPGDKVELIIPQRDDLRPLTRHFRGTLRWTAAAVRSGFRERFAAYLPEGAGATSAPDLFTRRPDRYLELRYPDGVPDDVLNRHGGRYGEKDLWNTVGAFHDPATGRVVQRGTWDGSIANTVRMRVHEEAHRHQHPRYGAVAWEDLTPLQRRILDEGGANAVTEIYLDVPRLDGADYPLSTDVMRRVRSTVGDETFLQAFFRGDDHANSQVVAALRKIVPGEGPPDGTAPSGRTDPVRHASLRREPVPEDALPQTQNRKHEVPPPRELTPSPAAATSSRALRDEEVQRSLRQAEVYRHREQEAVRENKGAWSPHDAPLSDGYQSFASWFDATLPAGRQLQEYIESTLAALPHRLALELGGIGSNLFAGFSPGFFAESAGVSLTDLRRGAYFESIAARDAARQHQVFEGNVLEPSVQQAVASWQNGRPLSLIVERMFAGIRSLPREPFLLAQRARDWYGQLAEGGLMFLEVPPAVAPYMNRWVAHVQAHHPALDVQTAWHQGRPLLRLHKRPGSPEELPLLDARTVLRGESEVYQQRRARTRAARHEQAVRDIDPSQGYESADAYARRQLQSADPQTPSAPRHAAASSDPLGIFAQTRQPPPLGPARFAAQNTASPLALVPTFTVNNPGVADEIDRLLRTAQRVQERLDISQDDVPFRVGPMTTPDTLQRENATLVRRWKRKLLPQTVQDTWPSRYIDRKQLAEVFKKHPNEPLVVHVVGGREKGPYWKRAYPWWKSQDVPVWRTVEELRGLGMTERHIVRINISDSGGWAHMLAETKHRYPGQPLSLQVHRRDFSENEWDMSSVARKIADVWHLIEELQFDGSLSGGLPWNPRLYVEAAQALAAELQRRGLPPKPVVYSGGIGPDSVDQVMPEIMSADPTAGADAVTLLRDRTFLGWGGKVSVKKVEQTYERFALNALAAGRLINPNAGPATSAASGGYAPWKPGMPDEGQRRAIVTRADGRTVQVGRDGQPQYGAILHLPMGDGTSLRARPIATWRRDKDMPTPVSHEQVRVPGEVSNRFHRYVLVADRQGRPVLDDAGFGLMVPLIAGASARSASSPAVPREPAGEGAAGDEPVSRD